jgi:hypothetical protein
MDSGRARSAARIVALVIGAALVGFSIWLALFANVDTDADDGPTNCGSNLFRVLADGPSRNGDVLTAGDCRTAAAINLGVVAALIITGVMFVAGGLGWFYRRNARRGRFVVQSLPQVVMNTIAVTAGGGVIVGGLVEWVGDIGLVAIAVLLPVVARSVRMAIVIDRHEAMVRNIFVTRRVPIEQVDTFLMVSTPWWVTQQDEQIGLRTTNGEEFGATSLVLSQFSWAQGPVRRRVGMLNDELHRRRSPGGDVLPSPVRP